ETIDIAGRADVTIRSSRGNEALTGIRSSEFGIRNQRIRLLTSAASALDSALLRRHVVGRTEHLAGDGQFGGAFQLLGQTEVRDMRLVENVDQYVRGLEVAV